MINIGNCDNYLLFLGEFFEQLVLDGGFREEEFVFLAFVHQKMAA